MDHRIEIIQDRLLVGKKMKMSFADNRTVELWKSFMPQRNEIIHVISRELYSLQVYGPDYFSPFSPDREFDKWAAVQVSTVTEIPKGMEAFTIPAGKYAVFGYKGSPGKGSSVFDHIFNNWLPASGYELDNRPHFELLGEKYKNESPDSEEEIWIPIRREA